MNYPPQTEQDYVLLIRSVPAKDSHPGDFCPADAMWFIAQEGLKQFPESQILQRCMCADGQGRVCESGEIAHVIKRWLEAQEKVQ